MPRSAASATRISPAGQILARPGAGRSATVMAAAACTSRTPMATVAHRGRGIASSALTALTAFAWTIPALYRAGLYIEPWNSSSIHVAEASGYQREGLLRSHQEIGGTRRDMLLYATTRP